MEPKARIIKRLSTYDKPLNPPVLSLKTSPLRFVEESMCQTEIALRDTIADEVNKIKEYVR